MAEMVVERVCNRFVQEERSYIEESERKREKFVFFAWVKKVGGLGGILFF
jgi:hypothetical protein